MKTLCLLAAEMMAKEQASPSELYRRLTAELGVPVAAMLDTKGPEIRTGVFKNGAETLVAGQKFTLTSRPVEGTNEICSITYKELPHDVQPGGRIMLDDGLIGLRIEHVTDTDIVCTVENDGTIKTKKGVNVPGVHLSMPYMSQRDKQDILFGIEQGFDIISASFTRCAADILEIRHLLEENHANIKIIAKIENQEGVDNIEEILGVADGIMVARGDMGVEIDFAEIPSIQKHLIDRTMSSGKVVITATQMLDSMISHPRPTRAEITDVANAIYDGSSAVMLSGETAAGKYPVAALQAMVAIAETTEADSSYNRLVHHAQASESRLSVSAAMAHAACTTASDIQASAIITVSKSGETARLLSRCRPDTPIVACVLDEQTQRHLALSWGVHPILMPYANSTDELVELSVEQVKIQCAEIFEIVIAVAVLGGLFTVMEIIIHCNHHGIQAQNLELDCNSLGRSCLSAARRACNKHELDPSPSCIDPVRYCGILPLMKGF